MELKLGRRSPPAMLDLRDRDGDGCAASLAAAVGLIFGVVEVHAPYSAAYEIVVVEVVVSYQVVSVMSGDKAKVPRA